ncbi:MAG TPA: glycosyltransferase family 4 protein, partial [Chloroflexota bacterium]|nr:glycosyltransferase family 4 protein [Chloroflexota bacterium]
AGGSGSNRALAFARYLREYGWRPTVVTPGAEWAMNRDDRLGGEIPADVRVIRTRSWEPRPHAAAPASAIPAVGSRSASNLRLHLGHLKRFPDAHLGWLPFALGAARRASFDVAYSSSGPFTSHLVGLALKRLTGRAWVAELRDGWYRWNRAIFPDYPAWRDRLERRLEARALRSADRVVLVTDRMAAAFRCQYADLPKEHFAVVSNGFDPAQFPTTGEPPPEHPGWNVVHAGALYYGRSLASFLEAAARVAAADASFAHEFRLTLIGTLDGSARAELIQRATATQVQFRGQLDHASTIEGMRSADALLLVANTTPGAEATVPGKLFEYLAMGRPVLAVAPPDSSTADVLQQTGGGWLAPAGEPEAIASVLAQAFYDRSRGADPRQVARFDRRVLAGDLACVFDQAVERATRRA